MTCQSYHIFPVPVAVPKPVRVVEKVAVPKPYPVEKIVPVQVEKKGNLTYSQLDENTVPESDKELLLDV